MNSHKKILRIKIDGAWTAENFADSFTATNNVYNSRLVLELAKEDISDLRLRLKGFPEFYPDSVRYLLALPLPLLNPFAGSTLTAKSLLKEDEVLTVRRVIYGSPGAKDFLGLGEIIGHVKDLIEKLIDIYVSRTERKLKNEKLHVEVLNEYLTVFERLGYSELQKRQIIATMLTEQQPLIPLIEEGKIVSVEVVDNDAEST